MEDTPGISGGAPNLVGREGELLRINRFLNGLVTGPRALVISGEHGMGKTALWRRGVATTREADHQMLMARCALDEMPLALAGLNDLIGSHGEDWIGAADIGLVERGTLLLELLRDLAEDRPVVLAIDDLQWLDMGTVRTLRYALRRLEHEPVGVLATRRVESTWDDPLDIAGLFPASSYDQIGLEPLCPDSMRWVLASVRSTVTRPTLDRIMEISGGNPLYALELARSISSDSIGFLDPFSLPNSLNAAISQHLKGVSGDLRPLLEMMATMGPTGIETLEKMVPDLDVPHLVEEGRDTGIIVVEDDLKVRFAHPLIGSAVYEEISPLRRRSLHRRVATNVIDSEMTARHLAVSTGEPDEGVARNLEDAAEVASRKGAFDLAGELASHSHRLTPSDHEGARGRRALAEAMHRAAAGETGRAVELLDGMISTLPSGSQRVAAVTQRFYLDVAGAHSFLEDALEGAGDDEFLRCRLLELLGFRHTFWGALDDAQACLEEAIGIARRNGCTALEIEALTSLSMVHEQRGAPNPKILSRALALASGAGTTLFIRPPKTVKGRQLLWAGKLEQARPIFEEVRDDIVAAGIEHQRPYRMYDLAMVELSGGALNRARDHVSDGLMAAIDAGNQEAEAWLMYAGALVDAWLGDLDAARDAAEWRKEWAAARGEAPGVARCLSTLGLIELSAARYAEAAEYLVEASEILERRGIGHPGAYPVLPDAIEALTKADRPGEALVLLEQLDTQADRLNQPWARAASDRARGVIQTALGEVTQAVETLMASMLAFEELRCQPDATRSLLLAGEAMRRAGERTRAAKIIDEARKRFLSMGATEWAARAAEELERVTPGASTGELTATESRIAQLVADGLKNREIAAALFVSIATVEAHLTRVYRKLAIRSRSELARLVAERAVAPSDPDPS